MTICQKTDALSIGCSVQRMKCANHIRAIEQLATIQRFGYAHFPIRPLDLRSIEFCGHMYPREVHTYMKTNVATKTILSPNNKL